jgi:hypothetical protein
LPTVWNIIGSVNGQTVDCNSIFSGYYQLLTWSGTSYTTATTIEPGKGYWALVLTPTHITVGQKQKRTPTPIYYFSSEKKYKLTKNAEQRQNDQLNKDDKTIKHEKQIHKSTA